MADIDWDATALGSLREDNQESHARLGYKEDFITKKGKRKGIDCLMEIFNVNYMTEGQEFRILPYIIVNNSCTWMIFILIYKYVIQRLLQPICL